MNFKNLFKHLTKTNSLLLIDGRLYVKISNQEYYEVIDSLINSEYKLKGGDILRESELSYCEDIIQIPANHIILDYLLNSFKKEFYNDRRKN